MRPPSKVRITTTPPIPYASALSGLLDYPYGCAEQTTSKGYAALQLDEATVAMLGIRDVDLQRRRQYVEGALGRLASMQQANGHFSMWGDGSYVNPLLTPYVVEFLLDAREGGFNVPEGLLQSLLILADMQKCSDLHSSHIFCHHFAAACSGPNAISESITV